MSPAVCNLRGGPLCGLRPIGQGQPERLAIAAAREIIPGLGPVWTLGADGSPTVFTYYLWSDGYYHPTPEPQPV